MTNEEQTENIYHIFQIINILKTNGFKVYCDEDLKHPKKMFWCEIISAEKQ